MPTSTDPCTKYSDGRAVSRWVVALRAAISSGKPAAIETGIMDDLAKAGFTLYQVIKVVQERAQLDRKDVDSLPYSVLRDVARRAEDRNGESKELFMRVADVRPLGKDAEPRTVDTLRVRLTRNEFGLLHGVTSSGQAVRFYYAIKGKSQVAVWSP